MKGKIKPVECSTVVWSLANRWSLESKPYGVIWMGFRYQLLLTARIIAVLPQGKLLCGLLGCIQLGLHGTFLAENSLQQERSINITAYL